jgi:uncharacterized membrane protein HdeD (DUF308 family)
MSSRSVPASRPRVVDGAFWLFIVGAVLLVVGALLLTRPAAAEWFDTSHD